MSRYFPSTAFPGRETALVPVQPVGVELERHGFLSLHEDASELHYGLLLQSNSQNILASFAICIIYIISHSLVPCLNQDI